MNKIAALLKTLPNLTTERLFEVMLDAHKYMLRARNRHNRHLYAIFVKHCIDEFRIRLGELERTKPEIVDAIASFEDNNL